MTEEKLLEKLMHYKSQHGLTQQAFQHYLWALETLKQHPPASLSNLDSSGS